MSTPTPLDTAEVPSSATTELYITNGNGSISTAASVGTLVFTDTPPGLIVMRATGNGIVGGHTTAAASITFGTGGGTPTFGGLDTMPDSNLYLGGFQPENEGTLTIRVPSKLTMRTSGAGQEVQVNCIVTGDGSIVMGVLPGESAARFYFGQYNSPLSTFAGGTQINTNTTLQLVSGSTQSSGSIINNGPLGLGTCNLNGGTLFLHSAGSLELANHINTIADSTIFLKADDSVLLGQIKTNGNRLTIDAHTPSFQGLELRNNGWHSSDTGTIAFADDSSVVDLPPFFGPLAMRV